MDKNVNYIKGFFTMTFSLLTSLFGVLAIPILLMVGTNIIDYATGFRNDWNHASGQLSGGLHCSVLDYL